MVGWGKGWKVTAAGWQVTLCDPNWHVISRMVPSRAVIYLPTYLHARSSVVYRFLPPSGTEFIATFTCVVYLCNSMGLLMCSLYT